MGELEKFPSENLERDFEVEIIDLEVPESSNVPSKTSIPSQLTPSLTSSSRWRSFLKRKPVQLAGVSAITLLGLVILLSLSGTLSLIQQRIHPTNTFHPPATEGISSLRSTVSVPQQNGLSCLIDATWSPDSKHLAVLGYSQDCPQVSRMYRPGLLNVYDARSVKLLAQVRPDEVVLSALRKRFSQERGTPLIIYASVLWSPDGRQMALPFVSYFHPNQFVPGVAGIFLLGENGGQTVFLWQEPEADMGASYLVWDLKRGVPQVFKYPAGRSPFTTMNLPPALTYHWEADGTLVAGTEKSAGSPASLLGPVGNPDGNASFTLWQPGYAVRLTAYGNGPTHLPDGYTWNASFTAWSPDGRYLANRIFTAGRFELPGQSLLTHQALVDLGIDSLSTLPMRDSALQNVLNALPTSDAGGSSALISWRPDGRVLATYGDSNVDLYDCATGHKLASLIPHGGIPVGIGGTEILRWSPDGSRLLLTSPTWGPVSLWQLNVL